MSVVRSSVAGTSKVRPLADADNAVDSDDLEVAALDEQLRQMLDPADYEEFQRNMARCDYDPEAAGRSF